MPEQLDIGQRLDWLTGGEAAPAPTPQRDPLARRDIGDELNYLTGGEGTTDAQTTTRVRSLRRAREDVAGREEGIPQRVMRNVPFAGLGFQIGNNLQDAAAERRVRDGSATDDDYFRIAQRERLDEIGQRRSENLGEQVVEIASSLPALGVEYAATGGLANQAARRVAVPLTRSMAPTVGRRVLRGGVHLATATAAQTALNPARVGVSTTERMFGGEGDDPRSFWQALPAGTVDALIETGTERLGGTRPFRAASRYAGNVAGSLVDDLGLDGATRAARTGLANRWNRMLNINPALRQAGAESGMHGAISEMMEERVGDVLRGAVLGDLMGERDSYGAVGQLAEGDVAGFLRQTMAEGLAFSIYGRGRQGLADVRRSMDNPRQRALLGTYLRSVADNPGELAQEVERLRPEMERLGVPAPQSPVLDSYRRAREAGADPQALDALTTAFRRGDGAALQGAQGPAQDYARALTETLPVEQPSGDISRDNAVRFQGQSQQQVTESSDSAVRENVPVAQQGNTAPPTTAQASAASAEATPHGTAPEAAPAGQPAPPAASSRVDRLARMTATRPAAANAPVSPQIQQVAEIVGKSVEGARPSEKPTQPGELEFQVGGRRVTVAWWQDAGGVQIDFEHAEKGKPSFGGGTQRAGTLDGGRALIKLMRNLGAAGLPVTYITNKARHEGYAPLMKRAGFEMVSQGPVPGRATLERYNYRPASLSPAPSPPAAQQEVPEFRNSGIPAETATNSTSEAPAPQAAAPDSLQASNPVDAIRRRLEAGEEIDAEAAFDSLGVTERERQIVGLVLRGQSFEDIAQVVTKPDGSPYTRQRIEQIYAGVLKKLGTDKATAEAVRDSSRIEQAADLRERGQRTTPGDLQADEEGGRRLRRVKDDEEIGHEKAVKRFLREAERGKRTKPADQPGPALGAQDRGQDDQARQGEGAAAGPAPAEAAAPPQPAPEVKPAEAAPNPIQAAAAEIRDFLDRRGDYDYPDIDRVLKPLAGMGKAEVFQVVKEALPDVRLGNRSKKGMIDYLRGFLKDILLSAHQSNFNLDPKAEAARQARRSKTTPKHYEEQAKEAGVDVEALHGLADELREADKAFVADWNGILSESRSQLMFHGGDVRFISQERFEDPGQIKGMDTVAEYWRERRPELFNESENADDTLFQMLKAGNKEVMSEEEAYRQALDKLVAEKEDGADPSGEAAFNEQGDLVLPDGTVLFSGPPLQMTALDAALRGPNVQSALGKLWQRWMTSRGDLPPEVFAEKVRKDGRIAAHMQDVVDTEKDLRRAIRATYGVAKPAEYRLMSAALRGDVRAFEQLPDEVKRAVNVMREQVDALTRALIDAGAVSGPLAAAMEENVGVYLNRSYRVFTDPDWAQKVPADKRNAFKAWLRAELTADGRTPTEDEIEGITNSLLYNGTAAESPIAFIAQSKLGSKDLGILARRKDVPPELRALWGEIEDPFANYAGSVGKMAHMLANHQFLTAVREQGMGRTFFEQPTPTHYAQIAAEDSRVMGPLAGLYTTPEVKRAFEEVYQRQQLSAVGRLYMLGLGLTKYAKTVGSHVTHIKNFLGNTFIAVANGHWRVGKAIPAVKLLATDSEQSRAAYRRLVELGVVGDNVNSNEFKEIVQQVLGERDQQAGEALGAMTDKRLARALRAGARLATRLYEAEDAVWKVYAFENEKARYAKAHPEWSQRQVEEKAAEIVRNTYPTYSMIPKAVRALRRTPFVAPFVSFPAEVVRTSTNIIRQGVGELRDPRTRAIGAQRLAGYTLATAGMAGLAMMTRALFGIDPDDEEAMRRFMPEWSENSLILHLGRDAQGNYRFIDLGSTNPYGYLMQPLVAALRGENPVAPLARPFVGEELLTERVLDVARNQTARGGEVYNPAANLRDRAAAVGGHLYEPFEPGGVTSLRRLYRAANNVPERSGRTLDTRTELAANLTGQRVQSLDVGQSLGFAARRFNRDRSDAARLETDATRGGRMVSAEERQRAHERSEEARRRIFEGMRQDVLAAQNLGMQRGDVFRALRAAGVSEQDAHGLLSGNYRERRATPARSLRR